MLDEYNIIENNFTRRQVYNEYTTPVVDTAKIMLELEYSQENSLNVVAVECYLRTDSDGEPYVDIYMYSPVVFETEIVRLVWKKDFSMSQDDENDFLRVIREHRLKVDLQRFAEFQIDVDEAYPECNIKNHCLQNPGHYLENLYFTLHRSGVREILYKSNLVNIAYQLYEMEDYNIIGSSPTDIFDMPLKLLKILNQAGLVDRLYTEASRNKARCVYEKFSDFINVKKVLPKKYQWKYLEEYEEFNDTNDAEFNVTIYKRLGEHFWTQSNYLEIKGYMKLASKLGELCPYSKKVPSVFEVGSRYNTLTRLVDILNRSDYLDVRIEENNYNEYYEYEDGEYVVILPRTSYEIFMEGVHQSNCVSGYIDRVALGETNIAFVRKKNLPQKSYITMEIEDGIITQALRRFNNLPSKEDYVFIYKYAEEKDLGIEFDDIDEDEMIG
ncbi:MAG: PcfJ domain-containing protein [Lachnospiraceae bacterium]|nr:PcfJ domain-containing protein [Lachnospiraceae bacterium]